MITERRSRPLVGALKFGVKIIVWIVVSSVTLIALWIVGNILRISWLERDDRAQTAPPGRWITAYDTRIHVQEWGRDNDPILMLVHGTGAWSGTWVSNVDALVKGGWRVVALDLPPFGYSERPANRDYSRNAQARRIVAAIESYGSAKIVLLGHSFGGGPAAEAAMQAPEKISHLVLLDAAIGLREDNEPCLAPTGLVASLMQSRGLRTSIVASTATQPLLTAYFLKQFVARKEAVSASRTAIYQQPFRATNFSEGLGDWAEQFAQSCEVSMSGSPAGWRNLTVPTSLVWGDQDAITPLAQAQRLNQLVPSARLTILPGVGHIPQIEDIAQFNSRVVQLLASFK